MSSIEHPHSIIDNVYETQKLAEIQHLAVTQGLKKLFKDTQWTVDQLSFVAGHKSVSAGVWYDLLLKFGIRKENRVKIFENSRADPVG